MSNHINTLGEVFAFLKELQHNNNREWFAAHKQQYDYLRDTWLNDLQRAHPINQGEYSLVLDKIYTFVS